MRKGLIGLLLTPPLLLAILWFTLPWSAQYLLQQWLQEQGFDQPHLIIQHPSWQHLHIDHVRISQHRDGRRLTLEADNIDIRFSPLALLQGQLRELRIEQAHLQIDADASMRSRLDQLEQKTTPLSLTSIHPAQLFRYAPSLRLVIAQLELTYSAPLQPEWSARGNIDLEPSLLQSRLQLFRADESLGYLDLSLDPALNLGLGLNHNNHYLLRSEHQLSFPEQHWQLDSSILLNVAHLPDWLSRLQLPITLPATAPDGTVRLNTRLQLPDLLPAELPLLLDRLDARLDTRISLNTGAGAGFSASRTDLAVTGQWQQGQFSLEAATDSQLSLSGLSHHNTHLQQAILTLTQPLQLTGHWQRPAEWSHSPLHFRVDAEGIDTEAPVRLALQPFNISLAAGTLLRSDYPVQLELPDIELKPPQQPPLNLSLRTDLNINRVSQQISGRASLDSRQLPLQLTLNGTLDRNLSGQVDLTLPTTDLPSLYRALKPWLPPQLHPLQLSRGQLRAAGTLRLDQGRWSLKTTPHLQQVDLDWDEHTRVHALELNPQLTLNANGRLRGRGRLDIGHTDTGVRIFGPQLDFDLDLPPQGAGRISLSAFSLSMMDGIIAVPAVSFDPWHPVVDTRIAVSALELDKILSLYPQEGLYGSGVLGGALPVKLDGDQLRIIAGQLVSQGDGGVIRYEATPEITLMAQQNPGIQLALNALTDFRFDLLDLSIDYAPDGEAVMKARLKGRNPDWQEGRPVDLNLNIEENLLDLLRTLRLTDRVTDAIDRRFRR